MSSMAVCNTFATSKPPAPRYALCSIHFHARSFYQAHTNNVRVMRLAGACLVALLSILRRRQGVLYSVKLRWA